MKHFDLSIIIVNWNTRVLITRCLESLAAACGDLHYETIVIDNASSDGSPAWMHEHFSPATLSRLLAQLSFTVKKIETVRGRVGIVDGIFKSRRQFQTMLYPIALGAGRVLGYASS